MTQAAVAAVLGIQDNRQIMCSGQRKPYNNATFVRPPHPVSVSVSRELVEVMEARLLAPVKLVQPVPWLPITQEGWHESRPCPHVCVHVCIPVPACACC